MTTQYATPTDALMHHGPGLQDFVTTDQLDQLIDGTIAPAAVAESYLDYLNDRPHMAVATSEEDSRADLVAFIRNEIEIAIEQRKEDAAHAKLRELHDHETAALRRKMELIRQAQKLNATKADIAAALGISRPTLDKMLQDDEDRALFNAALETLSRDGVSDANVNEINHHLGIRDVRKQAAMVLHGHDLLRANAHLAEERQEILRLAVDRASALTGR